MHGESTARRRRGEGPAPELSQLVLVPSSAGAKIAVKAASGTIIAMHGWTAPVQAVDDGFTILVKASSSLAGLVQL